MTINDQFFYTRKKFFGNTKKFNMLDCKTYGSPLEKKPDLLPSEKSNEKISYCKLVWSLNWLATRTCSDLSYAVGFLSRLNNGCDETHFKVPKFCLRYLKGTIDYGLLYRAKGEMKLKMYTDSRYWKVNLWICGNTGRRRYFMVIRITKGCGKIKLIGGILGNGQQCSRGVIVGKISGWVGL